MNWKHNLTLWQNSLDNYRLKYIPECSYKVLNKDHITKQLFHFIYIDGDHHSSFVLEDAILTWRLLKKDGIMLFDDYKMRVTDKWFYRSHKEFNRSCRWLHPRIGIDSFLKAYKGQYEIWINNYQIGLRKITDLKETI
jgi:hypothetical protein